jgi:hypothetical protein
LASAGQQQMTEHSGDKTLGAAEQSPAREIVMGMKFSFPNWQRNRYESSTWRTRPI